MSKALDFREISLIGWNGNCNVGDDAMTAVIINYVIQKIQPKARFWLLADKAHLAQYTGCENEINGFAGYNLFQRIPYVRRWLNPLLFDNYLAVASPILLIGGGSILHSVPRSRRLSKVVAATRRSHPQTLVGALGISLGPFKNQAEKHACNQVLQQLDFVAVRDQRSWDVLQNFNLKTPAVNAVDMALLLPELLSNLSSSKKSFPSIGVALRQGYTPTHLIEALVTSLNSIQAANKTVVIELLNFSNVDESISVRLQKRLKFSERVKFYAYTPCPEDMYQRLSACSLVLASRLHAAVISYAVGTPFGVLAYHQKCVDFAKAVGLDKHWIMPIKDVRADDLTQKLTAAIERNCMPKVQLALQQARRQARKNFHFLDVLQ